jgi:cold shock CspA family protein
MQVPLEISLGDVPNREEVERLVRERVERLERYSGRITRCRVSVEAPHRHRTKGQLWHVRVDLTLPGREVVVRRDPPARRSHEDVQAALRDAFDAARRQIQDHVRTRRGQTKEHAVPPHGRVVRLFPEEGYGFVMTADGRELYFHRHAVLEDRGFDRLEVGTEVRFSEETGEKGPQATSLRPVGRHHHLA